MKKLRMLFLLSGMFLLGAAPLAAQNTVDVLGGGPQPTDAPMPASWSTTSNAGADITTAITANYYFMPSGGATPLVGVMPAAGLICLADTGNLPATTTFAQIAANCEAGGGVATLIFPAGAINAPSNKPVFSMAQADGKFLENTVGFSTLTSISNFPIRINVAPTSGGGGPTGQHNCPSGQSAMAYVGPGTANFTPSESLCLPAGAGQGVEPSMIVDSQGTIYVESIRGVPGGLDLWRWNQTADGAPNGNGTLRFKYEGQPDGCGIFPANTACTTAGVEPGGGDGDVATNGPDPANMHIPNLGVVSLSAAEVTASHSTDRADTFSSVANAGTINPAAAHFAGDDRMWIDAYDDASTVAMNFHDLASGLIHVQLSNDGGATYNAGMGEAIADATTIQAANGTGSGNVAGQIKIDKNTNGCATRGNLYQIFSAPDSMADNPPCTGSPGPACHPLQTVYVGVSTNALVGGAPQSTFTFTDYKICSNTTTHPCGLASATNGTAQVFPALATDNNGFVYAVWSDNSNIYFASSVGASQGSAWNAAVRVNQGSTVGKANVFPWVAADANGHAVVAWLGADKSGNSNDTIAMSGAKWNVYAAETVNGNVPNPTFTQYTASDHVIHTGTVSTGGLNPTGSASRSLADFFQVALDPHHRANIAYADDHASSSGQPYFTRQLTTNPNITFPIGSRSCFIPVGQPCSGSGGGDAEGEGDERGDDGHEGHFKMSAKGGCKPSGEMDFEEDDTDGGKKGMKGGVDDVSVSGNTAIITGPCTRLDGTACRYAAIVVGNAFPAIGADLFTISWTAADGSFFHTSGILTTGSIAVHP